MILHAQLAREVARQESEVGLAFAERGNGNAEHPELKRRPTEYFKSNFLVAARGDEPTLPAVCDLVGDDYVTFNTDYPHPDGTWPAGMKDLEAQPIPEASLRKIFWDNAAPWLGLAA